MGKHAIRDSNQWRGGLGGALALTILVAARGASAQTVPPDPDVACTISTGTINGWFKSGTASLNGVVNPANSVSFANSPNCSFYEWSHHMFLWLTSPAPAIYGGGGGRIFESSAFFDVLPVDGSGKRPLAAHDSRRIPILGVFSKQLGPNHLPIVFDKHGRMFEVTRSAVPTPRVQSRAGRII